MDNKILEILIDIQKDVKELKIRQEEDHLVLKALEHNANVTNAEQEI